MKNFLVLLSLSVLLSCSQDGKAEPIVFNPSGGETVSDGLKWYDVIEPFYIIEPDEVYINGGNGGSRVMVNAQYIEGDFIAGTEQAFLAFIEFDDKKNYVGAERGRIEAGDEPYVSQFIFNINPGYTLKVTKGDAITQEQFDVAVDSEKEGEDVIWTSNYSLATFMFYRMDDFPTVGSVLANMEVYKSDDMNKLLGTFHLVL